MLLSSALYLSSCDCLVFEIYIDGKGITNAARKKAQLLHLAGMKFKIFTKIFKILDR